MPRPRLRQYPNVASKLMRHSLIIIIFFLTSCIGQTEDKQKINKGEVEYVEIHKPNDTVYLRLTENQMANFIENWNNSNLIDLYKYFPEYFLTVHFKGDSSLSFRTSSDLIKMKGDWAYSVGDKDYFKRIWFDRAGLSNNYFEYFPTYKKDGKISTDPDPLTDKHLKAIKQVLTYYNYKWTEIRGKIFYEGKIDEENLLNFTTKANDSVWLSLHR